ncbi:phage protein NinX family protein [Marinobacter sp. JSM 1782161]|uniref:phage protein NinX family protein n=1 Tax=Marinobacter sp. JSM 1782161 TaxID=2685906 RepID=UPI00140391AF|nr:phage protein NinX family protein [Marinobacter sp. JSM 1782161]
MLVKTNELVGLPLDWAVAQIDPTCNGLEWKAKAESRIFVGFAMIDGVMQPCAYLSNGSCLSEKLGMRRNGVQEYSPSTNWSQCGPLIFDEMVCIEHFRPEWGDYFAVAWTQDCRVPRKLEGATPLIAVCRAVVAAKLGDEVEIPDELVNQPA